MNWRFWTWGRKPAVPGDDIQFIPPSPLTELLAEQPDKGKFEWYEDSIPAPIKEVWNGEEYYVLKSKFNPLIIVDQACNVIWREGETIEQLNQDILVRTRDGARIFRTVKQEPDGVFTIKLETMIDRVCIPQHIPFADLPPYTD